MAQRWDEEINRRTVHSHNPLEMQFAGDVEELSQLLADPQRFPVIVVRGNSSSAAATLYQILPSVALYAYGGERQPRDRGPGTTGSAENAVASPAASPLAAVRLVTHYAASLSPQKCATQRRFVDILPHEITCETNPFTHAPGAASSETTEQRDEALPRHMCTQAFTELFFDYLRSKGSLEPINTNAPSTPDDDDGETVEGVEECERQDSETITSTEADMTASTHEEMNDAACDSTANLWHVTPSPLEEQGRVHWVVPYWVSGEMHELKRVLAAWQSVLSGKFAYETATLVFFINTDFVTERFCEVITQDKIIKSDSFSSIGDAVFTNVKPGKQPTARWRTLKNSSVLATELRQLMRNSPLQDSLCGGGVARKTTSFADETDESPASPPLSQRRHSLKVAEKALEPIRLPCLFCRYRVSKKHGFNESVLGKVFAECKPLSERMTDQITPTLPLTSAYRFKRWQSREPACLKYVPHWKWLLPLPAPSCGAPPASSHDQRASADISSPTPMRAAAAASRADPQPIFPYILVRDAASRNEELKAAAQRNVVNAVALSLLRAAASRTDHTTSVHPDHSTVSTAPQPRYYAPFVADAGSPLTVDGCMSDIFVLEFVPDSVRGVGWESWVGWLHRHPPPRLSSKTQRDRYRASLHLVSATEAFVAAAVPRRAETRGLAQAVLQYLALCGRGRGIMVWPLPDAREGHRRLRVAFTVSHEFYVDPQRFVNRHRRREVEDMYNKFTDREVCATVKGGAGAAHWRSSCTPLPSERTASGYRGNASWNTFSSSAASEHAAKAPFDASLAYTVTTLLTRLKTFGWVLVWQEDHRRWPTAAPPPCMRARPPAKFSQHFFAQQPASAAADLTSAAEARASAATASRLSSTNSKALQRRVASELEEWRQEQRARHHVLYDLDPAARPSAQRAAVPLSSPCTSAEDAIFAQSLERGLHSPHFPSPYTSLDLWQAGMVPEEAGMYLWKGQTVFLDNGQCGTIVDFRPPPAKLFTPWTAHPTEAERQRWRGQQHRHAAFIRYYRWRHELLRRSHAPVHGEGDGAARDDLRHLAAAFTALPSYVTLREHAVYPVVRLADQRVMNDAFEMSNTGEKNASKDRDDASPSQSPTLPVQQQPRQLVHVLPTKVNTVPVRYPSMCVVTAEEQERWYAAHPHVWRPLQQPLRDVTWRLTMTQHTHTNSITLLSLPLSPHRVEVCLDFFLKELCEATARQLRRTRLTSALLQASPPGAAADFERGSAQWAMLHRDALREHMGWAPPLSGRQRVAVPFHPFGHVRWRSFLQKSVLSTSTLVR